MLTTSVQFDSHGRLQSETGTEGSCDTEMVRLELQRKEWTLLLKRRQLHSSDVARFVLTCEMCSWDLGGQPRFRFMWERYCRGVNAMVYVQS